MQLPITGLFAGFLTVFAFYLSFRAGGFRGKAGVPILYGDPINWELVERVRAHQNFLEYVPMVLILMATVELNAGSETFLYTVGGLLILVRIAHAVGLKHDSMNHVGRVIGAGGTALISVITAGYAMWLAFA